MKETRVLVHLRDYVGADGLAWGSAEGRRVAGCLEDVVRAHPEAAAFRISFAGILQTDSSFARESIVAVAKRFRGQRGFCVADLADEDEIYNWDLVAARQRQPLLFWRGQTATVLGPQPAPALRHVLDEILRRKCVRASQIAADLGLGLPNASNKLRKLYEEGYVLRREIIADSGGVEYEYVPIE